MPTYNIKNVFISMAHVTPAPLLPQRQSHLRPSSTAAIKVSNQPAKPGWPSHRWAQAPRNALLSSRWLIVRLVPLPRWLSLCVHVLSTPLHTPCHPALPHPPPPHLLPWLSTALPSLCVPPDMPSATPSCCCAKPKPR